jgi:DNA-binding transcriptional LysR family regulator
LHRKEDAEVDLHQLRIFVVVAEEQNLTKGAQRLYMTPPTVSAHLKTLEDELGVDLFVRTPKGMVLTDKGKLLKEKAEATLQAAQALIDHAADLQSQVMGRLRCGLNTSPSFLRLAPLVLHLQATAPGIDLELIGSSSGRIIEGLQRGSLDAGYIFGAPPCASIAAHYLGTGEVVIAAPGQWAERLAAADWSDLTQLPWIGTDGYCPFESLTADLFQQRGLAYHHVVHSHDEPTKTELVAAGVGLAMLERSEAEEARQTGRLMIWETDTLYCDLYFAYLTKRRDEPLIKVLHTAVRHVWEG